MKEKWRNRIYLNEVNPTFHIKLDRKQFSPAFQTNTGTKHESTKMSSFSHNSSTRRPKRLKQATLVAIPVSAQSRTRRQWRSTQRQQIACVDKIKKGGTLIRRENDSKNKDVSDERRRKCVDTKECLVVKKDNTTPSFQSNCDHLLRTIRQKTTQVA